MKKLLLLFLALLLPLVAGCSAIGAQSTATFAVQTTAQATAITASAQQISVESVDEVSTDDLALMAAITLNGSTASADGDGVTVTVPP